MDKIMTSRRGPGAATDAVMSEEGRAAQFLTTIKILSGLIDMRFGDTAGHGRRCAEISQRAGVQLNLPPASCTQLSYAGLLHSLGKLALKDAVLSKKPAAMSPLELEQWKAYPRQSEEMLMGLEGLMEARAIIRAHQERWDGQGFPDRLRGTEIPMTSRILAAAIQMDRLRHGWDCPRALDRDEAAQALQRQCGKRLCPEATEAVIVSLRGFDDLAEQERRSAKPSELCVKITEVTPPCRLARDLLGVRGLLLLSAGHEISLSTLEQLGRYQERHQIQLDAWVKVT